MELKRASFSELRAEANGRTFEGYGAVFGNTDSYGDVLLRGCFRDTLRQTSGTSEWPRMLYQHATQMVIGRWDEIREDDRGLYVRGTLADTTWGRDVHALLRAGALDGLSIGYTIVSGKPNKAGGRDITSVRLFEISVVTFPANTSARVTSTKDDPVLRALERLAARIGQTPAGEQPVAPAPALSLAARQYLVQVMEARAAQQGYAVGRW